MTPSVAYLRECFCEENGRLFWLIRNEWHFANPRACKIWNTRWSGKEAGYLNVRKNKDSRWLVCLDAKMLLRYSIVWALHKGVWRTGLDHRNRDSVDDRIGNLREANQSQNGANKRRRSDSRAEFKGIYWNRRFNRWYAQVTCNGKKKTVGSSKDPVKAHAIYVAAARQAFGEFAYEE